MKQYFWITLLCLLGAATVLNAGTDKTVDFHSFMTPLSVVDKGSNAQANAFEHAFNLQNGAAASVFAGTEKHITLTNVDIPLHGTATLELERTRPVFDATTQFLVNTPDGKRPFTVRPIESFKGTVNGNPDTRVSLHYSNGDLQGFIQHADGSRTVVTRAWEMRSSKGATPHVLADENGTGGAGLGDFYCGNEDLEIDQAAAATSMAMPSSVKNAEDIQLLPLKQMDLAIVLREDIFTILQTRGYDEEQTAQHFAKIVACMSQPYEEELRTTMHISYLLIHTEFEPSGYLNDGRDPGALLEEFSLDWSSAYGSVNRTVAHLYTIKRPVSGTYVGGIAYGGQAGSRLCVKAHRGAYGVSTIDLSDPSQMPGNPNSRNGFVWDVMVAAHEIGHNVGAPHTHNCFWNPPVDTCQLQSDGTDACYNDPSFRRVRPGTIMSYCHLVNGSSTPLIFGDRVAERMRTWIDAAGCMTVPADPVVRITSPRGSDSWPGGSKQTIKWVSSGVSNVNLHYSANGGTDWKLIVGPIPAVDSQYVWTLPNVSTSNLLIRIQSAENTSVENISIAKYTISVPLELVAPAGGEKLGFGSEFNIRFAKDASIAAVDIEFSSNDGAAWETIQAGVTAANYVWAVPSTATTQARIRISNSANKNVNATSPLFSIGQPRFELVLPPEGFELCNNFDNQYRWNGEYIDRIRIQYSVDSGKTWRNALQALTVSVSDWQIFSRNSSMTSIESGTPCILQVLEADSREVLDERTMLTIVSCETAVSVNESEAAAGSFSITSVTPNPASSTVQVTVAHRQGMTVDVVVVDQLGGMSTLTSGKPLEGEGSTTLSVPVDALANGAYRILVRSGNAVVDAPLQIVR